MWDPSSNYIEILFNNIWINHINRQYNFITHKHKKKCLRKCKFLNYNKRIFVGALVALVLSGNKNNYAKSIFVQYLKIWTISVSTVVWSELPMVGKCKSTDIVFCGNYNEHNSESFK